jgi:hypothetical protein
VDIDPDMDRQIYRPARANTTEPPVNRTIRRLGLARAG